MGYDAYYRDFGARVRNARASKSQLDLARAAGMTRAAIANIETGRHRVTLDVLDRIARSLSVPVETLLPSIPADPDHVAPTRLARNEQAAVDRVLEAAGVRRTDDAPG